MNQEANYDPLAKLWSEEAEQAVLGAGMLDPDALGAVMASGLRAEQFYAAAHRRIFESMVARVTAGQPADPITVCEALARAGHLDEVGGRGFVVALVQGATTANAAAYAGLVVARAQDRLWFGVLRKACEGFTDPMCRDPIAAAEKLLAGLDGRRSAGGFVPLADAVGGYITDLDFRHTNPGIRGLQTGYHNIDHRVNGLQPGDLVVVGARPGMGKTNYLLNILRQVALQKQAFVLPVFSLEMGTHQLVARLLAAQGGIKADLLKSAKIFEHQDSLARLAPAAGVLKGLDVRVCDDPSLTVAEICSMTRTLHRRQRVGLVLVDYLGLVDVDGHAENQALRIAEITRALKKLAKQVGCPVIVAAQLSRKVEERRDKRPQLADLRDSGAIEQDADIVQFLYRDDYYNEASQWPGQVEVITAKIRDGEPGTDYLKWEGQYARMTSQSTYDSDGPTGKAGGGYHYDNDGER